MERGLLPGALSLASRFVPTLKAVIRRTLQALWDAVQARPPGSVGALPCAWLKRPALCPHMMGDHAADLQCPPPARTSGPWECAAV